MNRLGKIAGSTLFGGALVVGTAGAAFADAGHGDGPGQRPGTAQSSSDTSTQGTTGTQGDENTQPEDSTTGPDDQGTAPDDNGTMVDRDGTPPRQDRQQVPDGDNDADDTGNASTSPTSPNPVTPANGTTPSGGTSPTTTPPAFCADSSMIQSWFSHREAAVARQISNLGTAEGAAAARGDTTAVRNDRARITQLNGVESFLRAASAQLTSVCGIS